MKRVISSPKAERKLQFINLPVEIRCRIYHHVCGRTITPLLPLLQTNRGISDEVLPLIFGAPISFNGQQELFDWLDSIDRKNIQYVTKLGLRLRRFDTHAQCELIGERPKFLRRLWSRNKKTPLPPPLPLPLPAACDSHEAEIKRMGKALSLFTNVTSFVFLEYGLKDRGPSTEMMRDFCHELTHSFPQLNQIVLQPAYLSTKFLLEFPNLRSVTIGAFVDTCPGETLSTFSELRNLTSFSLISPHFAWEPNFCQISPTHLQEANLRSLPSLLLGQGLRTSTHTLRSLSMFDPSKSWIISRKCQQLTIMSPRNLRLIRLIHNLQILRLGSSHRAHDLEFISALWGLLSLDPLPRLQNIDLAIPAFTFHDTMSKLIPHRRRDFGYDVDFIARKLGWTPPNSLSPTITRLRLCVQRTDLVTCSTYADNVKLWLETQLESSSNTKLHFIWADWCDWFGQSQPENDSRWQHLDEPGMDWQGDGILVRKRLDKSS